MIPEADNEVVALGIIGVWSRANDVLNAKAKNFDYFRSTFADCFLENHFQPHRSAVKGEPRQRQ